MASEQSQEEEYEGQAGGDPDGPVCPRCFEESKRADDNLKSYERVKFKLSEVSTTLSAANALIGEAADEASRLTAALDTSEKRAEELRTALILLFQFRGHSSDCAYHTTDVCTCGLREAAETARAALKGGS